MCPSIVPQVCDFCAASADVLHMCLVCGFVGCCGVGAHGAAHALVPLHSDPALRAEFELSHAFSHFRETGHSYALELSSQRVYDYRGQGYVYESLYSQEGDMVSAIDLLIEEAGVGGGRGGPRGEHGGAHSSTGSRGLHKMAEYSSGDQRSAPRGKKKNVFESALLEFNQLLAEQLSEQRRYYEELLANKELELVKFRDRCVKKLEEKGLELTNVAKQIESRKKRVGELKLALEEKRKSLEKLQKERAELERETRRTSDVVVGGAAALGARAPPGGGAASSSSLGEGAMDTRKPSSKQKKLAEKVLIKELRQQIEELKMNLVMKQKFKREQVKDVMFTSGS